MILELDELVLNGLRVRADTYTLDDTEIKALRATPITIVAAQGAGTIQRVLAWSASFVPTTTGYTVGTNDLALRYKDGTGTLASATMDTAGFLDQTVAMYSTAEGLTDVKAVVSTMANQDLVLHNIGGSELTGGNAANTLRVTVYSVVETL